MKKSLKTYVIAAIAGILPILADLLKDQILVYLQDYFATKYVVLIIIGLLVFGVVLLTLKLSQKIEVDIDVNPLRDITEQKKYSQKGLIVFLSLYTVFSGKANKLKTEEKKEAVKNLDYHKLDFGNLHNNNLGHTIRSIQSHAYTLEKLWIVCTRSIKGGMTQSLFYAPVFAEYIKKEISSDIQIHYGKDYSVLLEDENIICKNTYKLIKKIYKHAKKIGIKKDNIITDVTGGIRGMTVGAILACIDKSEDIQYIGSKYDENGKIIRDSAIPMIVKYEPKHIE